MDPLKVLIVHNKYRYSGGEDNVALSEQLLLETYGHPVRVYSQDNRTIDGNTEIKTALSAFWSSEATHDLENLAASFRPDIIHVHNTFPLISPSIFWWAYQKKIPIIQTLHNFRFACLQAMFLRKGKICEDCLGKIPWRGIVRKCYRSSFPQSSVLGCVLIVHRLIRTYRAKVTRFIALNEFCKKKFIETRLLPKRISVKPNFVDIRAQKYPQIRQGGLFVGRISEEKGIQQLLEALKIHPDIRVKFIGTGPLETLFHLNPQVIAMGWQDKLVVYQEMARSAYLIMPSLWYENFPRTLVEAFACGLPVITCRLGAMEELVDDGKTGLLFEVGSIRSLIEKILWAESHPQEMQQMGENARLEYDKKYTPEKNYALLRKIYLKAIKTDATIR